MNIVLQLLLIEILICFIVDLSGFTETLKKGVKRLFKIKDITNIELKPFTCSLCMTWWSGLIWLVCTGNIHIWTIAVLGVMSFLAKNLTGLLRWLSDMLIKVENLLYKLIEK